MPQDRRQRRANNNNNNRGGGGGGAAMMAPGGAKGRGRGRFDESDPSSLMLESALSSLTLDDFGSSLSQHESDESHDVSDCASSLA
jgi:hypothetical protein